MLLDSVGYRSRTGTFLDVMERLDDVFTENDDEPFFRDFVVFFLQFFKLQTNTSTLKM